MTNVKGAKFLTITATANETYCLDYVSAQEVNVLNSTSGNLLVGDTESFEASGGVGVYLTIPAGAAANDIRCQFNKIYLHANAAGTVTIERCS